MNNLNSGKKNWDCRNYMKKYCDFFKWFGDEIVDERDLKIERQKKIKLKNEIV